MATTIDKKKQNGEVFTPPALAEFLAQRIMKYIVPKQGLKVNDPACGDGALLNALSKELNLNKIESFEVVGSDKDFKYLEEAKHLICSAFPNIPTRFEEKDFVEERVNSLFGNGAEFDIIIGNPPYVRTQTLGNDKSQSLLKLYGLSGRVDLYYPFLINMTDSLLEGGVIGVITSNRYLTTKSGESIRSFLLDHYDILEIIDLGDTKLFEAAVLPAIFIGRKNTCSHKSMKSKFVKIYEDFEGNHQMAQKSSIIDILNTEKSGYYQYNGINYNLTVGAFERPSNKKDIWQMATSEEQGWINQINANADFFVGDRFKVRVGVKSCADEVFLEDSQIKTQILPEDIFYRELISQENITPWIIESGVLRVIYPHYDDNGKKAVLDIANYPKATAFFTKHEARLKKRSYLMKSKRIWYEYWVPQNPVLWKYPKLVFPDISLNPRFAIDTSGAIVNGNCYWIYATNEDELDLLYLIEGVANSDLMTKYHDLCFNNKLYSGRRRYLSQYVEKYPIPSPSSNHSKRIVQIAKELHSNCNIPNREDLLTELNKCVEQAFAV